MKKLRAIHFLVLALMSLAVVVNGQDRKHQDSFVLNPQKPFVYLRFDRIAPGEQWTEDESPMRMWLELVNNCNATIEIHTFGGPDEAIGVMDNVLANTPPVMVVSMEKEPVPFGMDVLDSARPDSAKSTRPVHEARQPNGYWFHVSSTYRIPPGKRVTFSLPVNHLGTKWHVEIPFTFMEPPAKHGNRDEKDGGEAEMHILYTLWDLPESEQQKIQKLE